MPITAPPTIPLITDPSTFAQRAQAWTVWQAEELYPELVNQSSLLGLSLSATSVTSNTIGTGSKTFTVETGKGFVEGVSLSIAAVSTPTNRMFAVVTSYNSGTGELIVNSQAFEGSGTFTDWQIAPAFNGQINLPQIPDGLITNAKLNTDAKFGRLINRRVITASETGTAYTTGATKARVIVGGGGGGGGGVDGINPGVGIAESGSGGGQAEKFFTITQATYTVTIGAGGAGGAAGANSGTDGGTTTFTDTVNIVSATGGTGGLGVTGTAGNSVGAATEAGIGSGGDINLQGTPATNRVVNGGQVGAFSLSGYAPYWGGGKKTPSSSPTAGNNATNPCEGGSGAHVSNSTVDRAGGNGFRGEVILEEYA